MMDNNEAQLAQLESHDSSSSSEDEELGIAEVSGEAPIISMPKTLKKNESEALLNDKDDYIIPNRGFISDQDSSISKAIEQDLNLYEKLIANEGPLIKADQVTQKDLDAVMEPVYIENANLFDGGAPKLAPFLKKQVGGQPKVVRGIPEWLAKKVNINTSVSSVGTSINDVPRFLAIFDLPTYLVLLFNVRFWGLSWTYPIRRH